MNWLDVAIVIMLIYFAYLGMRGGFLVGMLELLGIVISILVPLLLYIPAGRLLHGLGVSRIYSAPLAFLIIWLITLSIYFAFARRLYSHVPRGVRLSSAGRQAALE